jgi:hypothetical protein
MTGDETHSRGQAMEQETLGVIKGISIEVV